MKITNPFELTVFEKADLEELHRAGGIKRAIKSWYRNISNAVHPDKLAICLGKNLPLRAQENVNAAYSMISNADDAQITAWISSYKISGANGTALAEIQSLSTRVRLAEEEKARMQSSLQQSTKKVQELESMLKTMQEQRDQDKKNIEYEMNAYKLQAQKQKEEIEKLSAYKSQLEKKKIEETQKQGISIFGNVIEFVKDIAGI